MPSHALKTQHPHRDNDHLAAKWRKVTQTHLALVAQESAPADSGYGADLGAFEEQYLLGYACFA